MEHDILYARMHGCMQQALHGSLITVIYNNVAKEIWSLYVTPFLYAERKRIFQL